MRCQLALGLAALVATAVDAATAGLPTLVGAFGAPLPLVERAQSRHCISWYKECIARQDQGGGPAPRCLVAAGCSPYTRLEGSEQAVHCTSWARECRARGLPPWEFRRCVARAGC